MSEERSTLRGIIVRGEDDKVIVQATRRDVERFAPEPGRDVSLRQLRSLRSLRRTPFRGPIYYNTVGAAWPRSDSADCLTTTSDDSPGEALDRRPVVQIGGYLYDEFGRPAVCVRSIRANTEQFDVTSYGSRVRQFAAGPVHYDIQVEAVDELDVR